jgi:hypothetical protein
MASSPPTIGAGDAAGSRAPLCTRSIVIESGST